MIPTINKPYVKNYDEELTLTNPIKDKYTPNGANRRQRREKKNRFNNNKKTYNMVIHGVHKFYKVLQRVWDSEEEKFKTIYHYKIANERQD